MIKHSHNGKGMVYGPNGISPQWKKALWPQWNIALWFIKKAWFYERLFLVVVMVMVKDKKRQYKRYMSIKISFMHYMKWTRVMLPVVFKEFEMVFFATFVFSPSLPIGKGRLQQKFHHPFPLSFYGTAQYTLLNSRFTLTCVGFDSILGKFNIKSCLPYGDKISFELDLHQSPGQIYWCTQEQLFKVFCKKNCFEKFRKFHKKTPIMKSIKLQALRPQTHVGHGLMSLM